MLKPLSFATATGLALSGWAMAHDYKAADLMIIHPMAFETAETAKTGAGYLEIVNQGSTSDRLVDVRADFPRVEIHNIEEKDGIASMIHMSDGIEIPANETVKLAPGGYHVMFMGVDGGLAVDTEIPATLVFEKAGEVDVIFKVEKRKLEGGHDHSGHGDHSNHSN